MPLHSGSTPANSAIFAQKARERALHVLSLREEHPGLMREEPPKPTVLSRLRKNPMAVMMVVMMVVMMATMIPKSINSSNNPATNLRAGGDQEFSVDAASPLGDEFSVNEDEGSSTSTSFGTFLPSDDEEDTDNEEADVENEVEEDEPLESDMEDEYPEEELDETETEDSEEEEEMDMDMDMEMEMGDMENAEDEDSLRCFDDHDFRYNGDENKSCVWASENLTHIRCGKPEVLEACRGTCHPECSTLVPTSTQTSTSTSTLTSTSTSVVSVSDEEMLSV